MIGLAILGVVAVVGYVLVSGSSKSAPSVTPGKKDSDLAMLDPLIAVPIGSATKVYGGATSAQLAGLAIGDNFQAFLQRASDQGRMSTDGKEAFSPTVLANFELVSDTPIAEVPGARLLVARYRSVFKYGTHWDGSALPEYGADYVMPDSYVYDTYKTGEPLITAPPFGTKV